MAAWEGCTRSANLPATVYGLSTERSADCAAYQPHRPWTPAPGGVDDEHSRMARSGVL